MCVFIDDSNCYFFYREPFLVETPAWRLHGAMNISKRFINLIFPNSIYWVAKTFGDASMESLQKKNCNILPTKRILKHHLTIPFR